MNGRTRSTSKIYMHPVDARAWRFFAEKKIPEFSISPRHVLTSDKQPASFLSLSFDRILSNICVQDARSRDTYYEVLHATVSPLSQGSQRPAIDREQV